ncbi:MAG: topoisomerase [Fluviicola sp.]|jgi:DNA topoisomerase-1|uniref:DNA topoisomerase IB n=1 Tax=Fluviicola sp. TaxID=1917219 RepID=UPI00260CFBD2|nr:DNA topoisomerase IB [Fluviicola sp.]MDF3026833.1 topoisomerase [Fluviicola sp.]
MIIAEVFDLNAFPEMADLVYVSVSDPGISRIRKGESFEYYYNNRKLDSEKQLQRIKALAIPPSWENVWICKDANGHIQCTGLDLRGRKQYRYHALWQMSRNESKFSRLIDFGNAIKKLRKQITSDLRKKTLSEDKVIATVLALMDETHIRVGNNQYEKTNKSYGLTTLKDRHVEISGEKIHFSFIGKKGIHHTISLRNKRLARIVKQCRDIPGKALFQYYDQAGNRHTLDSGKVNSYIRKHTEDSFTTKDLRTWSASVCALQGFLNSDFADNETARKKTMVEVLDLVSERLGNTRTICKKYYVHPQILTLYESSQLEKYIKNIPSPDTWLGSEEKLLLTILKKTTQPKKK